MNYIVADFIDELKKDWNKLPNLITFSRLPLAIIATYFLQNDGYIVITFIMFILSASTDFIDGWVARKFNLTSRLGAMLDPIVDKLFITIVLIGFCISRPWTILPSAIMFARELFVGLFILFSRSRNIETYATHSGKIKTFLQGLAYLLAIIPFYQYNWVIFGYIAVVIMYIAVFASMYSLIDYVKRFMPQRIDD